MDNNKKWILGTGIAAAGLTAVGAVSHALTKELVKIAVDRDLPQNIPLQARNQFKGSADNAAFLQVIAQSAKRLEARTNQPVEITARDGARLAGHWIPCENARRTVIAMHGWRSSWANDFGMIADFLHSSGCNVLYAEQRAHGSSGGDYIGLGALERYDCLDWIGWVEAHHSGLPVYLAGISMGATTVLMAAGLPLPQCVHGIVADCGFTSPHEIGRHIVVNNLHMSYGRRGETADAICKKRNQVGTKGCSAVQALKDCTVPVLFIHGADDHFVPVTMTYENYKACAGPKELLIVPGADHGMSYYLDRQRYEATVKRFWNRYD